MSEIFLPEGSAIVATLFRPRKNTSGGVVYLTAATPLRREKLLSVLVEQGVTLLGDFPKLSHPGTPVCLVLTVLLPDDGEAMSVPACFDMARAIKFRDLLEELPGLARTAVDDVFDQLAALAAKAAA